MHFRLLLVAGVLLLAAPAANASATALTWSMPESVDPGRSLNGVSCPSAMLCVAVGNGGRAVASINAGGGAGSWLSADVDGANRLLDISCATTRLCVATDNHAQVVASTDPTGGAKAWRELTADPGNDNLLTGVSCPSRKLCVTVDYSQFSSVDELRSRHPTSGRAWRGTFLDDVSHVGNVISCATGPLCAIADSGGNVIVGT